MSAGSAASSRSTGGAPSARDGRRRDRGVSQPPRQRPRCRRVDAQPGTVRAVVPVRRSARRRAALAGRHRPTEASAPAAGRAHPAGGERRACPHGPMRRPDGETSIRDRHALDGVRTAAGQGRGSRAWRDHCAAWQRRQGSRHDGAASACRSVAPATRASSRGVAGRSRAPGAWRRAPGRARGQVSQGRRGLGLVLGVSRSARVARPALGHLAAAPRPRGIDPAGGQARGPRRRHRQARHHAHAAARVRNAPSGVRLRHPDDPGTTRPPRRGDLPWSLGAMRSGELSVAARSLGDAPFGPGLAFARPPRSLARR